MASAQIRLYNTAQLGPYILMDHSCICLGHFTISVFYFKIRSNLFSSGNVDCFSCCFEGLMDFICFAARLKCYYEGGVGLQKTFTHAGHGGKRRYGMPMPGDSDSDDDDDDDVDDNSGGGEGKGDDGGDDEEGEGGMHDDSGGGEGDATFDGDSGGGDNNHEASSADSGSQADSASSLAGDGHAASGGEATEGVHCELMSSESAGEMVAHVELRGVGNVSGACKYTVGEGFGVVASSTVTKRRELGAREFGTRRAKSISSTQTIAGSRVRPTLTRTQSQGVVLVSSVSAAISAAVEAVNAPGRDEETEQHSTCVPTE